MNPLDSFAYYDRYKKKKAYNKKLSQARKAERERINNVDFYATREPVRIINRKLNPKSN